MAERSHRGLKRLVGVVACLVAVASIAGSPATGHVTRQPLRVVQMNLCDSGRAGCFTGRAVTEAAAVIRTEVPDLVTLNEICENDLSPLAQVLAGVHPGGTIVRTFVAARDGRTGGSVRCNNRQAYGNGILAVLPAPDRGYREYSGIYPAQDPADPEKRAWVCLHAIGAFYACTTHLAYTDASVTLAQCHYLFDTAIPATRLTGGYEPTVVGADLNLSAGGSPDVRSCVPAGYLRWDDGGVQQIVATTDFTVSSTRSIDMRRTTDHPALVVAIMLLRN